MATNDPRWLPLESWSASLGLKTEGEGAYAFQDVFGLEPECLEWVKKPVKAVLMLFPVTEAYEKMRKEQDAKVLEDGVEGVADVIYFKQTSEGPLTELFSQCADKTPLERAQLLVASNELEQVHEETAQTGQTAAPALEEDTDLHFVTFIDHDGYLIELDGRRNSPINHGKIKDGLLEDTVEYVKRIIELTQSIQFNLVTLSPAPTDD
ncbi:ubiquitinyl hydrolase 1 [Rhodosporidiobolus nylandii]